MPLPVDVSDLPALARRIEDEHAKARGAFEAGLDHALEAGRLLVEAKEQLGHGEWLPWLEANTSVSARTAQVYMKLARDLPKVRDANTQHAALLSIRDAIGAVAEKTTRRAVQSERRESGKSFPTSADGLPARSANIEEAPASSLSEPRRLEAVEVVAANGSVSTVEEEGDERVEVLTQRLRHALIRSRKSKPDASVILAAIERLRDEVEAGEFDDEDREEVFPGLTALEDVHRILLMVIPERGKEYTARGDDVLYTRLLPVPEDHSKIPKFMGWDRFSWIEAPDELIAFFGLTEAVAGWREEYDHMLVDGGLAPKFDCGELYQAWKDWSDERARLNREERERQQRESEARLSRRKRRRAPSGT